VKSYALGVDLGGTKVEAAVIDSEGSLLEGSRFRAPTGRDSSSDELQASVRSVVGDALAAVPVDGMLLGAGIGSAGPVDVARGLVSPLNLPSWRNFPLRSLVADAVGQLPVTLRIDGLCIALAEHWIGAAKGVENFLGMVVSTGIGGGLILNGRAFDGPTGNAGHIGHVEVGGFDDLCDCGGTGCVEGIASGPKTVAWAIRQGWAGASGEDLARSYAVGDLTAIAAVRRSGLAIGRAIASVTAIADLELVAIGGGFSHVTPDLLDFIRDAIDERERFGFITKVRVAPSALSGEGPLIGAAALLHRGELVP
jgi:glucokinase